MLATVGLTAACNIGPTGLEDGIYPCETNDDCTAEGFRCGGDGYCTDKFDESAPPCDNTANGIDQDGDGFGTGSDRSDCVTRCEEEGDDNCQQRSEPDCDDTDAQVFPFAAEVCDGKLNNCNLGAEDEAEAFSCDGSTDNCPTLADEPEGMTSAADFLVPECESGQCVYKSLRENDCTQDGSVIKMTCENSNNYSWVRDSTLGYDDLPAACRNIE